MKPPREYGAVTDYRMTMAREWERPNDDEKEEIR